MSDKVLVPVEPSDELLHSMAVRFDHGLGMPAYYDTIPIQCGLSHKERYEATLATMRQLHEEVVGKGFHKVEAAPEPASAEPFGYVFEKVGCRAPDDCEEYLEFVELKDINDDELGEYLKHGRAIAVYTHQPAQQWIKCSERMPTFLDADCNGEVWVYSGKFMSIIPWRRAGSMPFHERWMPTGLTKPQPPEV